VTRTAVQLSLEGDDWQERLLALLGLLADNARIASGV
jgi:FtsZ-binding cell division protein ZapB